MKPLFIMALTVLLLLGGSGDRLYAQESADGASGYERAISLLQEGILFEAVHELERFVVTNPDHEDARMLLARSLYRLKRDLRAAEEVSQVIRINADNMEARRLLMRIRLEIGQRLDRSSYTDVLQYARLCAIPGSYERAAEYYRLALTLKPEPMLPLEFARMLSWAGHYEESAYQYELFLKANPEHSDALHEAGRIYNSLGHFKLAAEAFERCLVQSPGHVEARLDLARAWLWGGQEEQAARLLEDLAKSNASGDVPLMLLASLARMQSLVLDEHAWLERVLVLNPANVEAQSRIKELASGSLLEIERLRQGLVRQPEDTVARRRLADLYIEAGRFADAVSQLKQIQQSDPGDAEILNRLQVVRAEEKRLVQARINAHRQRDEIDRQQQMSILREWLERNGTDMKSRMRLADLYAEGGDHAAALAQLEWLLEVAPENGQLAQSVARLRALLEVQKVTVQNGTDQ